MMRAGTDMIECWHIPQDAALQWHRWGDEYVVHHAASNDTHRLSAVAGELLTHLCCSKGASVDELARHSGLDDATAMRVLEELASLNLAATC